MLLNFKLLGRLWDPWAFSKHFPVHCTTHRFNTGVAKVQKFLIDDEIKCQLVRVIKDKKLVGDLPIAEALATAAKHRQNLILFKPDANPPLCLVDNVTEFLEKQSAKPKAQTFSFDPCLKVKTIQMSSECAEADFKRKVADARKFILQGHRIELIVYAKAVKSKRPVGKKMQKDICAVEKTLGVEASASVREALPKAIQEAKEQGTSLSFSLSNPLMQKLDYVYTHLCDVAKPFTLRNKVDVNSRHLILKFWPI